MTTDPTPAPILLPVPGPSIDRGILLEQELHGAPILMPFPGPSIDRGIAPEQELLEVLRRAVGDRVRLRGPIHACVRRRGRLR